MNFLDPKKTSDGKPYGPQRYKEIVRECYIISKVLHTSYTDVLSMSPTEKNMILEFIKQDNDEMERALEARRAERRQN